MGGTRTKQYAAAGNFGSVTTQNRGVNVTGNLLVLQPNTPISTDWGANEVYLSEVNVTAIRGQLKILDCSVTGIFVVAIGIYVAEWDSFASTWTVLNPLRSSDWNRPEWLHLEMKEAYLATGSAVSFTGVSFPVNINRQIKLVAGKGLLLAVAVGAGAAASCTYTTTLMTHYSRTVAGG